MTVFLFAARQSEGIVKHLPQAFEIIKNTLGSELAIGIQVEPDQGTGIDAEVGLRCSGQRPLSLEPMVASTDVAGMESA